MVEWGSDRKRFQTSNADGNHEVVSMKEDNILKWGIVGASNIARSWMIPAINAQPDAKVVAVYSSSPQRAKSYAAETGIPRFYSSLGSFLDDENVEAVYIGSRNDQHKSQAIAAAHRGKHVLCDKPLALSVQDAREMITACAQANVVFGTNHHLRSATVQRKMRTLIKAGAIGKPLAARAFFAVHLPEESRGWRTTIPEAGGGVVLDITVHVADTLRFVLDDDVQEVVALTANQGMTAPGLEDGVMGVMRFRSGLLAQFHDSFSIGHDLTGLQIHGTDGSLYAEENMLQKPNGRLYLRRNGKREEVPVGTIENHYEHLLREFIIAVRGQGKPFATGEDGLKSLAIASAIVESAHTRRVVTVSN
jgi:1,5-anhydro-D-fructose reductase (1,5-anhydro-D-mannitol-forming)